MRSRIGLFFLCTAFLLLLIGGKTEAFHSGGVAECSGCHSMHNATSPSFLLVGTDASSTCLSCHQHAGDTGPSSYHISTAEADMAGTTPPRQRTPGGDFGWLKKTYSWVPRSGAATETSPGAAHGHNIVAVDAAYVADAANPTAPGGTFAASQLGCQSCHDPHGRARRLSTGEYVNAFYNPGSSNAPIIGSGSYATSTDPAAGQAVGVYRLLRGLGDNSQTGANFAGVGVAIAPSGYNATEAVNQVRVAYGASGQNTWGAWCGTCHPTMHSNSGTVHPVDRALGDIASAYNAYVKTGDLGGDAATSYSSLVPFAEGTGDIATLKSHANNNGSYRNGPATTDQVTCFSCHRAHASGFDYMLRFNMGNEFMVINGTYTGSIAVAQGRTEAEMTAAYYDRPASQFATHQRVLCNKCHAKD
jgi:predicted CXXCH cytochrome family protein